MIGYPKRMPTLWRWDGEDEKHITLIVQKTMSVQLLNPTAAYIYYCCDGEKTLDDIIELFLKKYNVEKGRITQDVKEFLNFLISIGAVCYEHNGHSVNKLT